MVMTGTFKHQNADMAKEGFNPTVVKDDLFLYMVREDKFVPLTSEIYDNIVAGKVLF